MLFPFFRVGEFVLSVHKYDLQHCSFLRTSTTHPTLLSPALCHQPMKQYEAIITFPPQLPDSWTSSSLFDRNILQGVQMKTEPIHFAALRYWIYWVLTERYFSSYISRWRRGRRRGSEAAHLLGSRVRIPPGGHGCLSLVAVVCCQIEVSATGWSLVQRSPTDCGVCWGW